MTAASPGSVDLRRVYELASTIRQADERFRKLLMSGQIRSTYYSPGGQELIAAGIGAQLRPDDLVVTTYRGLHDHICKGVPLRELFAEFLGKSTGTCKGKGGPMHVTHPASGLMVTTGIVGSGLPIANGLALANQLKGNDAVTVVNFGDGASNIGAFHESLNMAAVWKLPVIFVCQNNQYGEHTRYAWTTSVPRVSDRGAGYSMPAATADGNDAGAVFNAAKDAIERARAGEGPTLLEFMTYRFYGHIVGDDMGYMPEEERSAALAADPVPRFRDSLVSQGHLTVEQLDEIDAETLAAIDDAMEFAMNSSSPGFEELYTDVYKEIVPA